MSMKASIKEFFDKVNSDNDKLKSHIKYIDTFLTILVVTTFLGWLITKTR